MIEVILDSSYLVALFDQRDHWHSQAAGIHSRLESLDAHATYFDCVMNETLTVMGKRLERRPASVAFSDKLIEIQQQVPVDVITWLYPGIRHWYPIVLSLMQAHQGSLSFHDALMVAAAREMGIQHIVSFDADFDDISDLRRIQAASDLQPDDTDLAS